MQRGGAETTKNRLERVVPYSAPTGVLLSGYLAHRATISRARGPLFLSESRRNHAQPLTLWTWSKVVRRIVVDAGIPRFSTHTTRHLCLTDLARMGWELHAIAAFAGHRSTDSTLTYIHVVMARHGSGMTNVNRAVAAGSAGASDSRQPARSWHTGADRGADPQPSGLVARSASTSLIRRALFGSAFFIDWRMKNAATFGTPSMFTMK